MPKMPIQIQKHIQVQKQIHIQIQGERQIQIKKKIQVERKIKIHIFLPDFVRAPAPSQYKNSVYIFSKKKAAPVQPILI